MNKLKYTLKTAKEKSLAMGFRLISENFLRTRDKYEFYCIKHKQNHNAIFDNIIRNKQGLKCCGLSKGYISQRYTLKEVEMICNGLGIQFLDKIYFGRSVIYKFKCAEHNKIYNMRFSDIRKRKPICCNLERRFEKYKKIALARGFFCLDNKYKKVDSLYRFKCLKHNEIHECRFNNICNIKQGLYCCWVNMKRRSGKNHPNYNPNLTEQERLGNRGMSSWRKNIYKKYNRTCQVCNEQKFGFRELIAHHVESYTSNRELRYELSNGICLCTSCHDEFHKTYGYGNNTRKQFDEFKKVRS